MDYSCAHDFQNQIVSKKIAGTIDANLVMWLEHYPVFTLGRHGGQENLMVSRRFLSEKQIPVIPAERGGNITYHGPGQLVCYPLIHLQQAGLGVAAYVHLLEQVMIQVGHDFSVAVTRNQVNPGVWAGNKKMGSVGITIRHGVSFHGFALNIDMDLEPFQWMNPCGLADIEITSLERESRFSVDKKQVQKSARQHFCNVFGIDPIPIGLPELEKMLAGSRLRRA